MIVRPTRRAGATAALIGAMSLGPWRMLHAADEPRPSFLLGGGAASPPAAVPIDPKLPSGAPIRAESRPTGAWTVACGLREPVCVHHAVGSPPELVRDAVHALESARARFVSALGLPAPLADAGLGPTPGLDLYLDPSVSLDVEVAADRAVMPSDRRSAFCRARPSRTELSRQATTCVAEAILLGVNAASPPFLRQAIAAYLASLDAAPTPRALNAYDLLQSNPQLCVASRDAKPEAAAGALLFRYADAQLSGTAPGILPVALAQLARTETTSGATRWQDEPDIIDVLRRALTSPSRGLADFMLGFAIDRAFLGARDNGRHHPELAWLGEAGSVRFDWVLQASSLPRRVAPRRPLEPFGSAYVWLELDRITLDKAIAFRAEWEEPSSMRWSLLTIDAQGDVLRRFDVPFVQNATSAERSIVEYDGAVGVLVVGINLGGIDAAHPFDPDHEPFEPHAFTVYLTEL